MTSWAISGGLDGRYSRRVRTSGWAVQAAVPLALLTAGLTSGLGGCSLVGDGTDAGDTLAARTPSVVEGTDTFVQLPGGRLDLTIGAPVDHLDAGDLGEGEDAEAPDGGGFVGLSWQYDGGAGVPTWHKAVLVGDDVAPEITLLAGGERYPLGSSEAGAPEAMFVAVEDADAISVEVAFDGVAQTVTAAGDRDPGAAEPLYGAAGTRPTLNDCAEQEFDSGATVELTCSAEVTTLPYVADLGWAPDGRTWALVRLETSVSSVRAAGTTYDVTSTDDASTLDGANAALTLTGTVTDPGTGSDYRVYPSTPGAPLELDLRRTYRTDGPVVVGTAVVPLRR